MKRNPSGGTSNLCWVPSHRLIWYCFYIAVGETGALPLPHPRPRPGPQPGPRPGLGQNLPQAPRPGPIQVPTNPPVVLPPPVYVPTDQEVLQGQQVTLACPTGGQATSNIQWTRNGLPLIENIRYSVLSTGSLLLANIQYEDRGLYKCHYVDSSHVARASHRVTVQGRSPSIHSSKPQGYGHPFYSGLGGHR